MGSRSCLCLSPFVWKELTVRAFTKVRTTRWVRTTRSRQGSRQCRVAPFAPGIKGGFSAGDARFLILKIHGGRRRAAVRRTFTGWPCLSRRRSPSQRNGRRRHMGGIPAKEKQDGGYRETADRTVRLDPHRAEFRPRTVRLIPHAIFGIAGPTVRLSIAPTRSSGYLSPVPADRSLWNPPLGG